MGNSTRRVRTLLRQFGHQADVYAVDVDAELAGDVLPVSDAGATRGDITIYHYGIQSALTAAFQSLAGRRVLQYHNVTPAEFFEPWDTHLFKLATRGREELATL